MFDKLLASAGLNFNELCLLPARTLAADLSEDQNGAKGFGGFVLMKHPLSLSMHWRWMAH